MAKSEPRAFSVGDGLAREHLDVARHDVRLV